MRSTTLLYLLVTFLVLPEGGAAGERLINTRDSYPSLAPDGVTLVFQSNRNGSNQLYAMNLEDNRVVPLTDFARGAETPVFSPDGRRIVFAAYVDEGNNDVFVMNADGSDLKQLTHGPGYDGHPHWSFDGQRIVFNSDRTTPDAGASWGDRWHEIFSMKTDGSDVRQHTRCQAVCTFGSISPGGDRVLYRKVIPGPGQNWNLDAIQKNSEIFVSDLAGSKEINLTNDAAFDGWPAWSPDGTKIAFASNRSGPALTGQIWLMNADGSGVRQLSQGGWSHVQPAWTFDGRRIVAYQNQETRDYEFGSVVRISID